MKRIQRILSQKSVLLLCLIPFLFSGCGKGGAFTKTTHWFGKVIDPSNNSVVPGCLIIFYRLENNKGSWWPYEITRVFSGPDGSYSITFERRMGDYDFESKVDSVPSGYIKDYFYGGAMDESVFKDAGEVHDDIFVFSAGYMKVHVVGDGDSPKMELGWGGNLFYHGCDTNIVFTGRGNRSFNLSYTMYDANNPGVKFERWFNDVLPRQDTVYKELHF